MVSPLPTPLARTSWIAAAVAIQASLPAPARGQSGGSITRYIDPGQQVALPFPMRSHWLQPWRAYLDTPPTSRLRDAVGINLNVDPDQADAVCRHLTANGFRHVRVEFGWGSISWDDPTRLADPRRFDRVVGACRRHGLRPLFLLNAHHGVPVPIREFRVRLARPASKGDRVVHLDPGSLRAIVPGRSGLSGLTDYKAAEVLFTEVAADGTARLSKPLPKGLPAGEAPAATLRYLPFSPATTKAGGPSPRFAETLAGWLDYVRAITAAAKAALGTETAPDAGFDLEVWNELTFGSDFLDINRYYDPPVAEGRPPYEEILARTVAYVVDSKNGLPGVGVCDGFNNQWPWGSGAKAPPGLAALGKHPYAGVKRFPADRSQIGANQRPVNALGTPEGRPLGPDRWADEFIPSYVSHFPEYTLTAIQGEHLVRDLSPIATTIQGVPHGRTTRPNWPDGRPAPAPGLWITEVNLDPAGADPGDLAAYLKAHAAPVAPGLTRGDADRMKAKALLRYLTSFTNKGLGRVYFFAVRDENPLGLGLVSDALLARAKGDVPADDPALASPAMLAVRRLVAAMPGGTIAAPRSLSVLEIAEEHGHKQFEGDPATAGRSPDPHPPLYNRDVLGVFPFQATDSKFVVATYVMTRNLARLYRPEAPASDPSRFDLPAERYRLTLGGVRGPGVNLDLYDPLTGEHPPATRVAAEGARIVVELPLTDSPRLLTIEEAAEGTRRE